MCATQLGPNLLREIFQTLEKKDLWNWYCGDRAEVASGDILVGKFLPKAKVILQAKKDFGAIFLRKSRDVKDSSLYLARRIW
jgi:DNA-directed RNA polymerase beta subunit